jgi:hypothetical protein
MNPNSNQSWNSAFKSALLVFSVELVILYSLWTARWLLPVIQTAAMRLLTPNN